MSGTSLQGKASGGALSLPTKPFLNNQLNVLCSRTIAMRKSADYSMICHNRGTVVNALEKSAMYGTRLHRAYSGSERSHIWQSDGPGKAPKLKVVVRSGMSQVPEKPLGLYDPKFDKDSCGVGFVAQLSGQGSRKTVKGSKLMLLRVPKRLSSFQF